MQGNEETDTIEIAELRLSRVVPPYRDQQTPHNQPTNAFISRPRYTSCYKTTRTLFSHRPPSPCGVHNTLKGKQDRAVTSEKLRTMTLTATRRQRSQMRRRDRMEQRRGVGHSPIRQVSDDTINSDGYAISHHYGQQARTDSAPRRSVSTPLSTHISTTSDFQHEDVMPTDPSGSYMCQVQEFTVQNPPSDETFRHHQSSTMPYADENDVTGGGVTDNNNMKGFVYASDSAFVDMILKPEGLDLSQLDLQSYSDDTQQNNSSWFSSSSSSTTTTYFHELKYRGDLVWLLETSESSNGEGRCICHIADDATLRVRVSSRQQQHQRRRRDYNNRNLSSLPESRTPPTTIPITTAQRTTRERYTHDLFQLLRKSAEQYQLEMARISGVEQLVGCCQ